MAEALFFAANNTHPDAVKDRRGCWKRGFIVVVKPDGHVWGRLEDPSQVVPPRRFALLKFPGVSVTRIEKYIAVEPDPVDATLVFRRRLWQVQFAELPQSAKDLLQIQGVLTIGATGDFTWAQVRNFFMRLDTNERETEAL